jgi:D-alanyl-D-alanine dipeptidase
MFGDLSILRAGPLPTFESARRSTKGYRDFPIDQTAAAFAEKLVPAKDFGVDGRNHYAHARNPPYWARAEGAIEALLVREGVAARLQKVNARLAGAGLKLHLYDAWRPRAVQAYFHDVWMPDQVRRNRPGLSDAEVRAEVERYWAAPSIDALHPAPHATGGAVDLTIVWADGEPLFMGALFDDTTEIAATDYFEGESPSLSHQEACANRRLLYWLMIEAGFANHPGEWWHYSYGDQMWAALTGAGAALYGLAEHGDGEGVT